MKKILVSFFVLSVVGCNAILDNEEGTLSTASTADDAGGSPTPSPTLTDDDAAAPPQDAATDTNVPTDGCPTGQHMCNGTCVSLTDPTYGCGDPACMPCAGAHGTMACQGGACVVSACDPGYANCNGKSDDGCETDMSSPTTCGACNATCAAATPLCAASGSSFQCTNGCTADEPVNCGGTCVNPVNNANNCGSCGFKCPLVTNGTATCTLSVCGFTCKANFHSCGGKCVATTDPTACGDGCTVCPVPTGGAATCTAGACGTSCTAPTHLCGTKCVQNDPTACGAACTACAAPANATATCAAETCGFTCAANYGDCNLMAADGCEASLMTDAANCGACGKACAAGKACVMGACAP